MQQRTILYITAAAVAVAAGVLAWTAARGPGPAKVADGPPSAASIAAVPAGYPRSYAQIIEAASREGKLSIYSATDAREVAALLADFHSVYPSVKVEYADLNSTEIYSRFIAEVAAREGTADILWSSAMDLQIKLVNDGYAQAYASPEKPALPDGAVWKNEAWGTTAEPIVFAYNKRLLPAADVPHSHAELTELLARKPDAYRGKITSYNPEKSGVGFLYITQDAQVTSDTWDFVRALGPTKPKLYTSTGAMMERIVSGEHLLAFNMIGSYALERAAKDPNLGVILPDDYTLVMSRIALIPADARHPNAAKLFLDFLLSKRGQEHLRAKHMRSVRNDMPPPEGVAETLPETRQIRVGPALLANLDQVTRLRFLKRWRETLQGAEH